MSTNRAEDLSTHVRGVHRAALHLVASERHAERARAAGLEAKSIHAFLLECANWNHARPATVATTRLATALALEAVAPDLARGSKRSSHARPEDARRAQGPGWALACALDDALGALRIAGTDPKLLKALSEPRAQWFGRLLETVDGMLAKAGLFDTRQAGFLAAKAIARMPLTELPERVIVDSWFEWNQVDFAWVEALSARLPLVLRMPHCHSDAREGPDAFWDDSVVSRLEERWHSLVTSAPEIELVDVARPTPDILIEAAHDEAECRAVVAETRRALRAGIDPERIGILVPDLDEAFAEPLRSHLIEAGIAYSEPRGRPPIASPVVAAAFLWLSLLEPPMHRDEVIELLEAAVIDPKPWIAGPDRWTRRRRAQALAHLLKRTPIGVDPDGTLLHALSHRSDDDMPAEAWMRGSLSALLAQLAADRRDDTRGAIAERLRMAFDRLGLFEVSSEAFSLGVVGAEGHATSPHAMLARLSLQDAASGMRALEAGLGAVETGALALGRQDEIITVARFRSELEAALGSVTAQPGLRRAGTVQVIRAGDGSCQDWDVLIVTRASEGTFGTGAGANSDALLDDGVVSRLPAAQRPHGRRLLQAARTLELGVAMSRARRLVLTRRRSDADGRPDPPAALFAEWAEQHRPEQEPPSAIRSVRVISERMQICKQLATSSQDRARLLVSPDVTHRTHIELARQRFFFDPAIVPDEYSGAIDMLDARARAHLTRVFGGTRDRPIPLTAIERAAKCRFAAWAERVLGATEEGEAGEAVDPSQRGNIVHRALKLAMDTAVFSAPPPWDIDTEVTRVLALVRQAVLKPPASPLYAAEVDRALCDVEAVLRWSLEGASAFRYSRGEQSFGSARDAWQALRLSAGDGVAAGDGMGPADRGALASAANTRSGGTTSGAGEANTRSGGTTSGAGEVYVRGCIDRIDMSPDGTRLRVIDYKTGSAPSWGQVGIRYFQPLLYAAVARRELGPLLVRELFAMYLETAKRPVRTVPGERNQGVSQDSLVEAEQAASALVHRVWAGDVPPRPWDAHTCLYCSSRVICRRPMTAPSHDPSSDESAGT